MKHGVAQRVGESGTGIINEKEGLILRDAVSIFEDLGYRSYKSVWDLQEEMLKEKVALKAKIREEAHAAQPVHHLLFVEHSPVYTLGKSGKEEHILIAPEEMAARVLIIFISTGGRYYFSWTTTGSWLSYYRLRAVQNRSGLVFTQSRRSNYPNHG